MKQRSLAWVVLFFCATLIFSSFKAPYAKHSNKYKVPPQYTKTQNFTVNGRSGTVKLQYNSTGIYLAPPTATISGIGNVLLQIISHSPGSIIIDKWKGTVMGPDAEYTITVIISGFSGNWNISQVIPESVVI